MIHFPKPSLIKIFAIIADILFEDYGLFPLLFIFCHSELVSESGLFFKYRVRKAGMINFHMINVSCLYLYKNDMDNVEA